MKKRVNLGWFFLLLISILIVVFFTIQRIESPRVVYEVVDQCSDGVQNSGETGVDCGGVCTACSTGDSGSPGGGGGGGSATTPSVNETRVVETASPEIIAIFNGFNADTGIKEIQVRVTSEVQNISINVLKYDGWPANVSVEKPGKVYKYLQIEATNLDNNLKNATIISQIEKTWLESNGLDISDMAIFKFDEANERWKELETTFTDSDETYNYYNSELDSFSYFTIAEKTSIAAKIGIGSDLLWILIVVIVIIVILLIVIYRKKRMYSLT